MSGSYAAVSVRRPTRRIAEATISPTGCVRALSVLHSVSPALDVAALNAVAVVLHANAAQRHARARDHDRDGELPPQL